MSNRPASLAADAPPLRLPWMIFVFALLVRFAVIAGTIGLHTPAVSESASDSGVHIALVQSLLAGHGYSIDGTPIATTPPLYIFFLAGIYALSQDAAAVRLIQALLGSFGCVLLYMVARKLFDRTTGIVAAALLSMYPLTVYLTGLHLTENLFLFLLLLILVQSLRVMERPTLAPAVGLGVLIGLASLTRAIFVGFLPFLLAWAASLWGFRHPLTYRIFGLATVSAALVILPWTVRNYLVLGGPVPIQSNAGMIFWAGNNPSSDGNFVLPSRRTWITGTPPNDSAYGWRGVSSAEGNRRYLQAALTWIREHPRDYLALLARKFLRLYGFSRAADDRDLHVPRVVMVLYGLFLTSALGGILLTIRQWRTLSLILLLIIFTNVVTLLFSGGTRYSIPMIPSLLSFSAAALTTAGRYLVRAFGLQNMMAVID